MKPTQPKIGLVIGAGGVKCAAALGVYRVLRQAGYSIDLLVGCSGGSIYASFLALGLSALEAEIIASQLWTREVTQEKNGSGYLRALMPRSKGFKENFALRDDRLILERLRTAFGENRIEDAKIPLLINATNFDSGEGTVFERGRIVDAIRSSIAIPGVFRPWEIEGNLYSDGMLSNPLPIDVAARAGCDVIIAVGFEVPLRSRIHNTNRFNMHVNSILSNSLLRTKIELCKDAFDADVLVLEPDFGERVHIFDTRKIPQIVEAGASSASERLFWLENRLKPRPEAPKLSQYGMMFSALH